MKLLDEHNYYLETDLIDVLDTKITNQVPYSYFSNNNKPASEFRKELEDNYIYQIFQHVPKLPEEMLVSVRVINGHKVNIIVGKTLKTTSGTTVEIIIYGAQSIEIFAEGKYYSCNQYYKRPVNFGYIIKKLIEETLTINEVLIPREMFHTTPSNRIKNDLLRPYEKQINQMVFYSYMHLYTYRLEYVPCFSIDVSEVYP